MKKDLADLVKGWLAKGDSDLATAAANASGSGPYDTGCFHCQQAVEKYLKAILSLHGKVPPKIHDIQQLVKAVEKIEPAIRLARPEIFRLTDYGATLRYDPDFWPQKSRLDEALAVARQVRLEILVVVPVKMHPGPP